MSKQQVSGDQPVRSVEQIAEEIGCGIRPECRCHFERGRLLGLPCAICAPTVAAIASALREARQQWQPIETAPKDGTYILLAAPRGDSAWLQDVGCYTRFPLHTVGGDVLWDWGWTYQPTHWMPLPDPPRAAASSGAQGEK